MSLLEVRQLRFQYSRLEPLFQGISFEINPGDRVGLVGPNGAGKTTLLRILASELEPDAGVIIRRRGLRTAYLEQSHDAPPGESLADWLVEPGTEDIERVLYALGFESCDFSLPLRKLSAGQRARAYLAKCLLSAAELLLLDEPTNHLDIRARAWLGRHLERYRGACILVSHDRHFLEAATTRTFELRRGAFQEYGGGYGFYERERQVRKARERAQYEAHEKRVAALQRAAARRARLARKVAKAPAGVRSGKDFYASKAAKVARTARLLRERELRGSRPPKPWEEDPIPALDFSGVPRSGEFPIQVESVWKGYGDMQVFADLTLRCRRGERWALLAPNGSGKTTLLRLLLGLETPDQGRVAIGSNVRFGYYPQEVEYLEPGLTPVEICAEASSDHTLIRTLLACLKLPRTLADQRVGLLSLGERAKVALVRVLVAGANVLLLDEPTNHLEIEAQEALEATLRQFPGTILFVSHDVRFVERLADHVLEFGDKKLPRIRALRQAAWAPRCAL